MNEIFDFFDRINNTSWSGEVEIKSAQGHAIVTIFQGKFLWAYRPVDRSLERFNRLDWLITPKTPMKSWEELALTLLQLNGEQENRVIRLLKMERLEVFFRLFFWSNTEIIEHPRMIQMPSAESLGFYSLRGFDKLLQEAKTRLSDWPRMKSKMGSSKRVFVSLVPSDVIKKNLEATPSDTESDLKSFYTFEELEILAICDGRNSVQDLVRQLPYGEFFTIRALLDLWRRGAVRAKDEDGTSFSRVFEQDRVTTLDMMGVLWAGLLTVVIFCIATLLEGPRTPTACDTAVIAQALEIYRNQSQHYPLTLAELPPYRIAPTTLEKFRYRLNNPVNYSLGCRGITGNSNTSDNIRQMIE